MIEVKVTVELPGIPDALNNLARAIADSHCAVTAGLLSAPVELSTPAPVAPVTPVAPVAPVTVAATAPVAPVAPAPASAPVAPVAPVAPAPVPAPAPASAPVAPVAPAPAPVAPVTPAAPVTQAPITQHALSVAGAKLVDMGKMDAVVNLLKQYGAVAITQLKEEQYASFAANLRNLGVEV